MRSTEYFREAIADARPAVVSEASALVLVTAILRPPDRASAETMFWHAFRYASVTVRRSSDPDNGPGRAGTEPRTGPTGRVSMSLSSQILRSSRSRVKARGKARIPPAKAPTTVSSQGGCELGLVGRVAGAMTLPGSTE